MGARALRRLRRGLPDDVLLLVDEAYAEFADPECWTTQLNWAADREDVAVVRTFSKAYGLAGARIGWTLAPTASAQALHALRGPFNTSAPACAAAIAALHDRPWLARVVDHARRERRWLRDRLLRHGLGVPRSHGNFLLVDLGTAEAARRQHLAWRAAGLLTRELGPYGLDPCLRVTLGSRAQHRALLAALVGVGAGVAERTGRELVGLR